jgi:hypothetical protein
VRFASAARLRLFARDALRAAAALLGVRLFPPGRAFFPTAPFGAAAFFDVTLRDRFIVSTSCAARPAPSARRRGGADGSRGGSRPDPLEKRLGAIQDGAERQSRVARSVSSQTTPGARQHLDRPRGVAARAVLERDGDLHQPLEEVALGALYVEPQRLERLVRGEETCPR